MIEVYHGGTEPISHPLVSAGREGLDFGKGFYVTLMREQAELWADRMARQRKSDKILSIYELDMDIIRPTIVICFFLIMMQNGSIL